MFTPYRTSYIDQGSRSAEMSTSASSSTSHSRWVSRRVLLSGTPSSPSEVSIYYISCKPPLKVESKGTILLIHGFPQTSYQFRHVITPLSDEGYHVIAPDYRGAGYSSKPRDGYEKTQMAADLHELLTEQLGITNKVHVVGHDIGGMVAHAYASRFPDSTASIALGECPLPGTQAYDRFCRDVSGVWHFHFHWQTDLPEMLTFGREKEYLQHFFDRLCVNVSAITPEDVDYYTTMFSKAGAMRAGFDVYRAFHKDVEENRKWVEEKGKCKVPCISLNGGQSFLVEIAEEQNLEMYETTENATVEGAGHYCAEENPTDFIKKVLLWVGKHVSS